MKKILLIIFLAFVFLGIQVVNAQQNYNITVTWDDKDCQCENSYDGFVKVVVIDTRTNDTIINTPWTHDDATPHLFTGTASIVWDCRCYSLNAAVYYNDGSVCCQGTNSGLRQGQELISGTSINVNMQ